ncbi:MAG TPA: sterol desaturase family protein [Bacteroidia bacterium]|jgi:sterol desaturase/sphingolipid hydroxylase (fatty acid hydroxylase superfamily)|nr:sterol desaturase family protein [Bacteroidia bacterium]
MNWNFWTRTLVTVSSRYFLIAGIAFLIGYVIYRRTFAFAKIQPAFPEKTDYRREIGYSILTMLIFTCVPTFILTTPSIAVHTLYYKEISRYGLFYFWSAFIIMLFVHDTYFYWVHRIMHHPKLFRAFHLVHHKSTNPSPWAAYAFHPLEALVEVGVYVLFLFLMPIHTYHLMFFFLFMIIYNVYGHLGYELYPRNFNKTMIGRYVNTSVSHNQHHKFFKGNYGLYFTIWDRLMGTMREDYDKAFEEVKTRRPLEDSKLRSSGSAVS